MRIHSIVSKTASEGPGLRFCLWVQGCSRHCKGCFNPETWDPAGGEEWTAEALLSAIDAAPGIEGVTLLGGEPFEQPGELTALCAAVRARGLSVAAFTGYTLEELRARRDPATDALLGQIDLLMDGPFILEQQDFSRPWIGSRNQRYHFLTDRYSLNDIKNARQRVEFRIGPDGSIAINGMPDLPMQTILGMLNAGGSHGKQE